MLTASRSWLLVLAMGCGPGALVVDDKTSSDETGYVGLDPEDTGEAASGPDVVVDPLALDLGVTTAGVPLSALFTVTNAGDAPLTASVEVSAGSGSFAVNTTGAYLVSGASTSVTVTLQSNALGDYTGAVTLTSDDPGEPTVVVALAGRVDVDSDGDGWMDSEDCDPLNAAINPAASEIWYDGVDDNCDGLSDYDQDGDGHDALEYGGDDCNDLDAEINPDAAETWYDGVDGDCDNRSDYDQDGDGYDSIDYSGADCDDLNPLASPGTLETEGNAVDDDCDGLIDEARSTEDLDGDGYSEVDGDCNDDDASMNPGASETWYDGLDGDCNGGSDYDQDADGYDDASFGGADCVDTDAAIHPAAGQVYYDGVDSNCDGLSDYDADGDGYDSVDYAGEDCDDADATVNPDVAELYYDGIDADCDGASDFDMDADGYDDSAFGGSDCQDEDPTINPASTEICDGIDQDCDGQADNGVTTTYYADADGDTYGDPGVTVEACVLVAGFTLDSADCNDAAASINPMGVEVCDGIDQDCDGVIDDGVTTIYYADADTDGYGSPTATTAACSAPTGYVSTFSDCNDADRSINPAASDTCDGVDNDCDGSIDEGLPPRETYYADADADGYGSASTSVMGCGAPGGYVSNSTDCNDLAGWIHPGATETCDGVDQDCDGSIDEGLSATYYRDADGDGYGTSATTSSACSAPSGYVANSTDCNDASASINPGAAEICDGVDQDCDGSIDEGLGALSTYYADSDGDGYGNASSSATSCSAPSGYVSNSTDCDDADSTSNPGASEIAYDVADNDCDTYQDEMVAETESDWTVLGDLASDAIGSGGVQATDDLDGDGNPELVICAPAADYYYYTYYLVSEPGFTSFHDVSTSGLNVDFSSGYYEYYGYEGDDYLGSAFAVVDDLDGDGYTEVAFGSYQNNAYATDDGEVYLIDIQGETGTDYAYSSYADSVIYGSSTNGWLGYSLAAGDFDGDGMNDLATGAPGEQSARGRVYVTFEQDGLDEDALLNTDSNFYTTGVSTSDYLGMSVAFGDFGGDGYDDLVACSPYDDDGYSNAGTCWVVDGASTRDTTSVAGTTVSSLDSAVITGSATSDSIGLTPQSLSVGDFNGDSRDDLAVGVAGYDGYTSAGGGVWIYLGGSLSGSETVSTANYVVRGDGAFGTAVNMTSDLTGDGIVDLLGGATTAGSSKGVVYLLEGGVASGTYTMPTDQYASWTGKTSGDLFGSAISDVRDLDGDGRDDFAVAAIGNDDGASNAGKVYVLPAYP